MKRPTLFCLLFVLLAVPQYAYGYLDPSTGSMLLQVAIGGFLAVLAAVRIYWSKIRSLFSKGRSESNADATK